MIVKSSVCRKRQAVSGSGLLIALSKNEPPKDLRKF
jgi:hypothetical protein